MRSSWSLGGWDNNSKSWMHISPRTCFPIHKMKFHPRGGGIYAVTVFTRGYGIYAPSSIFIKLKSSYVIFIFYFLNFVTAEFTKMFNKIIFPFLVLLSILFNFDFFLFWSQFEKLPSLEVKLGDIEWFWHLIGLFWSESRNYISRNDIFYIIYHIYDIDGVW